MARRARSETECNGWAKGETMGEAVVGSARKKSSKNGERKELAQG
jgi:hypothetical protein